MFNQEMSHFGLLTVILGDRYVFVLLPHNISTPDFDNHFEKKISLSDKISYLVYARSTGTASPR